MCQTFNKTHFVLIFCGCYKGDNFLINLTCYNKRVRTLTVSSKKSNTFNSLLKSRNVKLHEKKNEWLFWLVKN